MSDGKVSNLQRIPGYANIKEQLGIIIGLLLLCVLLSVLSSVFLTSRNFFNVLLQLANNMFLSCGMLLVILTGGIDLSVGSTIAVTGCFVAGFITNYNMPAAVAVLLALLIGVLIGIINASLISFTGIPAFIITLATMNIGRGVARLYTSSKTITVDNDFFAFIGTGYLFNVVPIQVVYIILVCTVTGILLNKTKFGRSLYATGGNPVAASFSGINTKRVIFTVYVFSSLMAAIAGICLASRMYSGTSTSGQSAEMDAIAACVIGGVSFSGGVGTVFGVVVGVVIFTLINYGLSYIGVNPYWQYIIKGSIIVLAVAIDSLKHAKKK